MIRALALLPALLFAGCAAREARLPPQTVPTPVLSSVASSESEPEMQAAPVLAARGQPLAGGLPATVRSEAPMRAQPLTSARVLRTVSATTPVRVLGAPLDNASGHWLSVLVGDTVGWLPAELVELTR